MATAPQYEYTDSRINPRNYLGNEHNKYKSQLYAYALAHPDLYFETKLTIEEAVKDKVLESMYNTLFYILSVGKNGKNGDDVVVFNGKLFSPNLPNQKINETCLTIANSMNEMLDEVLEKILPNKFEDIMKSKFSVAGKTADPQA
jgi:hypothetical protein